MLRLSYAGKSTLLFSGILPVALVVLGCVSSHHEPEKFEKVPLESVFYTGDQPGVKQWGFDPDSPFKEDLLRFLKLQPTASNIFLTTARDETEASTAAIRLQGRAEVSLPPRAGRSRVWLIAFFGFAPSDPTRWTIESVEISATKIRLSYAMPQKIISSSADSRPYFALVPLKELTPGKYDLELRNAQTKEVTLMRKITLSAIGKR